MKKLVLLLFLFIGIILIAGCKAVDYPEQEECPECEQCEECPDHEVCLDDKPLLDVDLIVWAINEYDNSEILFDYWIYNYGDSEAKDIKVKCRLEDFGGKILKTVVDNYGNLASRSGELGEVVTSKPTISMTQKYMGYCFVKSCRNCEILYKRIPYFVEAYES